jgi:hypothetical protein
MCFLLLRIDITLGMLAGAKWFSTLYLKFCYWQVALHPNKRGRRCSQRVKGCGGLQSCSLASAVLQ